MSKRLLFIPAMICFLLCWSCEKEWEGVDTLRWNPLPLDSIPASIVKPAQKFAQEHGLTVAFYQYGDTDKGTYQLRLIINKGREPYPSDAQSKIVQQTFIDPLVAKAIEEIFKGVKPSSLKCLKILVSIIYRPGTLHYSYFLE